MASQIQIKYHQAKQLLQQQFKRIKKNRVTWDHIQKNKRWKNFFAKQGLMSGHEQHKKKVRNAFKKGILQNKLTTKDSNGNIVSKYVYDESKKQFIRISQFDEIKDIQNLKQYIQKNPKGILVTEELLDFTYKDIKTDLQNLQAGKLLRRIDSSNKNRKDYYIFPNVIDQTYGLEKDKHQFYGQKFFIQLCKENYKYYTELNDQQKTNSTTSILQISSQRVNEWVPGYSQLKKQWLLKNQQKDRARDKN